MSLRDINFLPAYETGINDLVNDFYIPILEQAKRYDRIAGFFSSTSLALAARGISGLVKNQGSMRLITCPKLEPKDVEIIEASVKDIDLIMSKSLLDAFDIEDEFQSDHVAALGWLLSKGILDMRIALVYEKGKLLNGEEAVSSSIMHQKIGLVYDDECNGISFSGSNNESASGWLDNIEEFKVFQSWIPGQRDYYSSDQKKFERMWNGEHPSVKIKTLPQAVKEKLIEKGKNFDLERISLAKYKCRTQQTATTKSKKDELTLFSYQKEAVKTWQENGNNLLLEMATGCGKTRTAIGCIKNIFSQRKQVLAVISCPGNTLSMQWKTDIDNLDVPVCSDIICDGTNPKWHKLLEKFIKQISTGLFSNGIIYTTHQTCSSDEFIQLISNSSSKLLKFFIGDEVHGMGADKTRFGLLPCYEYRLGLSATPSRWFDELGTKQITEYFGNKSFVFSIHDALTTINPTTNKPFLVNFSYHPNFINLTDEELEEYKALSDKIAKMSGRTDVESKRILEFMLFKRANMEKSAYNKYQALRTILNSLSEIEDTIIFVSNEQIDEVLRILADYGIPAHSFTEKQSSTPSQMYGGISERQHIINMFKNKSYHVLVAIKCLDEGIDIPSAKRAIVMASSTNPREYVQRVGRVIRQGKHKENAEIYDMIIKPDVSNGFTEQFRDMEQKIFLKEMDRVLELSENAINNIEVLNSMYDIKRAVKNDSKHCNY